MGSIVLWLRFGLHHWEALAGDSTVGWEEREAQAFVLLVPSLLDCSGLAVSPHGGLLSRQAVLSKPLLAVGFGKIPLPAPSWALMAS